MNNLIRRYQNREIARDRAQNYAWEPFRMLDAFFGGEPIRGPLTERSGWPVADFSPSFDVKETKDGYLVRVDLPGVREADLELSVTGNVLAVSGKREQENRDEGDQYFALERSYGSFARTLTFPEGANLENVEADLKDGVLTLQVPKRPEVQPRKISIGKTESKAKA